MPLDSSGDNASEYLRRRRRTQLRLGESLLKVGEMTVETPVFDTSDKRLQPQYARGFFLQSDDLDRVRIQAGRFTAFSEQASSSGHGDFDGYGASTAGSAIGFAGASLAASDNLSGSLFAAQLDNVWRQVYLNMNLQRAAFSLDGNLYRTRDQGRSRAGAIDTLAYSLQPKYRVGAQGFSWPTSVSMGIRRSTSSEVTPSTSPTRSSTPISTVPANAPGRPATTSTWPRLGLPGLSFMARYVSGRAIDGSHAPSAAPTTRWAPMAATGPCRAERRQTLGARPRPALPVRPGPAQGPLAERLAPQPPGQRGPGRRRHRPPLPDRRIPTQRPRSDHDRTRRLTLESLRQATFRWLWLASIASNIGTWMHEVGAGWLMTSLSASPLNVAPVQVAGSLPMFFLALPAGALADIVDKRRYLLGVQLWMALVATLLASLTLLQLTSVWLLLGLTLCMGIGTALMMPAWSATTPELVGKDELPAAVALSSVGVNLARAVGPAIAGVLVSLVGPWLTFALNALSFFAVIAVLLAWKREAVPSVLPAERLFGALRAGWRYSRSSRPLQSVLVRAVAFFLGASAGMSLLP